MSTELPIASRRDTGLPLSVTSHKSGGRDQWTGPLSEPPDDPVQATWNALKEVLDPELPISLVDLGLIYGLELDEGVVRIQLTFTATACPCMEFIREDIRDRLEVESWVDGVEIEEVWSPPWTTEMITPEGRETLKRFGVTA